MSRTATYHTTVIWKSEHWGHVVMGNGPEMDFSAPPDAQGHPGVFTPEDAFVAAANTCVMMMFLWAAERFKLNLISPLFGFQAPVEVWRKFLSPNPPPLFHDFFAMLMRVPEFVLEGDGLMAMQNARALHRMMNIMRETGAPNA